MRHKTIITRPRRTAFLIIHTCRWARCGYTVYCLCVCTVTDCSAEDKASGVTFCSAVHRRSRQGISHFGGTLLSQKPKNGRIGQRAGHAHRDVNISVGMRHTRDARRSWNGGRGSACMDIRQSQKTDVFVSYGNFCISYR